MMARLSESPVSSFEKEMLQSSSSSSGTPLYQEKEFSLLDKIKRHASTSTTSSEITFSLAERPSLLGSGRLEFVEKNPTVSVKHLLALNSIKTSPVAVPTTTEAIYDGSFNKKARFDLESHTEFSSGYEISRTELIVIMLILLLWILSLRKFVKNFEKIRTIHYREIPYKYKSKEPDNISQIRVVKRPKEAIIYSKDPLKCSRSRSFPLDSNSERADVSMSSLSKIEQNLTNRSNRSSCASSASFKDESVKKYNATMDDDELLLNETAMAISQSRSKRSSSLDANEHKLNARRNRNQDDSGLHDQIYSDRTAQHGYGPSKQQSTTSASSSKSNRFLNPHNSNLLDTNLLSPLIKRSLLDLHAKSIENIAAAASQATSSSLAHTHTILKNKDIERKKKLRKQHAAKSTGSSGSGGYASVSTSLDRDYRSTRPLQTPGIAREDGQTIIQTITTERTEPYQNRYTKYNKNFFNAPSLAAQNSALNPFPRPPAPAQSTESGPSDAGALPLRYLESPV